MGEDGSLYVAMSGEVRRVHPDGTWTRIAGTGTPGFTAYAGAATEMQIGNWLVSVEVSAAGDVFIGDRSNKVIWLLRDDTLTRLVGNAEADGTDLDQSFATQDEEALQIFEPGYPPEHPQYGEIIFRRNRGEAYPATVNLACLQDLRLSGDGFRLWILQSCGSNGRKRIRLVNLSGDLPWLGDAQPPAEHFYDHRARVKHVAGWPYPSWLDIAKRPNPEVVGQPGKHYGWNVVGGGNLYKYAIFGEEWAIWRDPQSITTGNGTVYVAEWGMQYGTGGSLRKFRPGGGTTTLGLEWHFVKNGDELQCTSSHCQIEVTGYDGVDHLIDEVVAHDGRLFYATQDSEEGGVFVSSGSMPGHRILGGGKEPLDVEQLMTRAAKYDLVQARDLAVGPDGSLYVADYGGRKVVRVARISTPGYEESIVASRDNSAY